MFLVIVLSPKTPGVHPRYFLFFAMFGLLYWQKDKIRVWLSRLSFPETSQGKFFLVVVVWAFLVEHLITQGALGKRPFFSFLLSLFFVLPYFYFWYKWIFSNNKLGYQQVFYLSGFAAAILQTILTPKIITPFFNYRLFLAFLVALFNFVTIMTVFGVVTVLPYLLAFDQPSKEEKLSYRTVFAGLKSTLLGSLALILIVVIFRLLTLLK